jgi:hypothetical protein
MFPTHLASQAISCIVGAGQPRPGDVEGAPALDPWVERGGREESWRGLALSLAFTNKVLYSRPPCPFLGSSLYPVHVL